MTSGHISTGDLLRMTPHELALLPGDRFRAAGELLLEMQQKDRRENALLWYRPASARAMQVHESTAKVRGIGGGNGSSKSETALAEMIAKATGVFPLSLAHLTKAKFRGPINCRHVCESLTTVLEPVILPKLQWWKWTGQAPQGTGRGHWGWVPRRCLKDGQWDRSWSQKLRTLTVLCYDPERPERAIGESMIQFMSTDQESEDFASGDYHEIVLDEPPKHGQWRESQARTMRVDGNITLAMTWPEDPAIPVDWLIDEIYDKAKTSETTKWFELVTTENDHLDQASVARQMADWDDDVIAVRIYGKPIRFSNLIHPEFTDSDVHWCFDCKKRAISVEQGRCITCGSPQVVVFNHVDDEMTWKKHWPGVFILDPHPRKPHMWLHAVITPSDDVLIVNGDERDADPDDIASYIDAQERDLGLNVALRLIDPNMGRSPASAKDRGKTWQDEFDAAGLKCDLASDADTGRARINAYLKPDPDTRAPRLMVSPRASLLITQIKRYAWDEHKRDREKATKEKPRDKNDDGPTMLKYLFNHLPSFQELVDGAAYIQLGQRRPPPSTRGASR